LSKIYSYYIKVIGNYPNDNSLFVGSVIETDNPNVTIFKNYEFNISAYSLIENKDIINRLNKILVFK